jgi:hypothetical protein
MHSRTSKIVALMVAIAVGVALAQAPPFKGIKILSNGNVGIGTENPQSTLHVVGDATITGKLQGADPRYVNAAVLQGMLVGTDTRSGGKVFNTEQPEFVLRYDFSARGVNPIQIWAPNLDPNSQQLKNFIIANPTNPKRYLVHATLEGPEGAVYYRGSSRLVNGRAEVVLPHYFERLARRDDRTILLTNVDGFDQIAIESQFGQKIKDGRFVVTSNNPSSTQAFDWEVKAVRADAATLKVEPLRDEITVGGFGPYTFVAGKR